MTDPRKVRVYHGHKLAWSEVWENNPRFALPDDEGDFQTLYARSVANNMRPYHLSKSDQKWTYNLSYRPEIGELYFSEQEKQFAESYSPLVLIEPNIKPTGSPNKQWGWERWCKLVLLARKAGMKFCQVGRHGTRQLPHTTLFITQRFRMGCAILSRARAYVGGEGGLHHAAAALGIPGVVIFGGFTPVELTGYPMHRNLGASLGEACGMRLHCDHCKSEMAKIKPEFVLEQLIEVMRANS